MTYTEESYFFNYSHPLIQEVIEEFKALQTDKEKAVGVYLKIRDGWRYNPYKISFRKESYRAVVVAAKPDGHCIDKAILLTTALRGLGIPSRLHLAKVANHIAVERLTEKFGSNELTPHGMTDIFLNGKWLKTSPAFNKELCEKCNVATLDFDGEHDSVFQEFDRKGNKFMVYLEDYGAFDDMPLEFIRETFQSHYPKIYRQYEAEGETEL